MNGRAIPRSVPSTPPSVSNKRIAVTKIDPEGKARYLFSPKPISLKTAPRAWERRPATPFAPRSESHKIWKRCLIRQLGRNGGGALPEECSDGWRRSVKRLRVLRDGDRDGGGEEEEAVVGFVGTSFVAVEDMERARERKKVNEELGEALRSLRDAKADAQHKAERGNTAEAIKGEYDVESRVVAGEKREDISAGTSDSQENTASRCLSRASVSPREDSTNLCQGPKQNNQKQGTEMAQHMHKGAIMVQSDDREYLHAFLTRARAKKAAEVTPGSPGTGGVETLPVPTGSPQTRSHTILSALDESASSAQKVEKLGDVQASLVQELQADEPTSIGGEAPSPLRKSTRKRRAPGQQMQAPTPNTIPFRRSNGTEFIFLQKTEAQQTAISTRSNTRKNKGEALEPKLKLQALSAQCAPSPAPVAKAKKKHDSAENSKRVWWDEGLTYFAQTPSAPIERAGLPQQQQQEEASERTPVKRNRRSGSSRGTPAPKKKMAEAALEVVPSAPRTRSRERAK